MTRKILVETTADILLIDPYTGCVADAGRPSVVDWSQFIETRVGIGQVRIIGAELVEEVKDEDFLGYWAECKEDAQLAVAAFMAEFEVPQPIGEKSETVPVTDPTPAGKAPVPLKEGK